MFTVEWTRKAIKQLKRFDRQHQRQIVVAVRDLKHWPDCQHIKALKGQPGYRLRVGRYRIFFEIETTLKIITVEEVKKRDERTISVNLSADLAGFDAKLQRNTDRIRNLRGLKLTVMMNVLIDHQIIEKNGEPLFVLVPYEEYLNIVQEKTAEPTIPHDVVELHILEDKSLIRAWREYKGLSQREMAERMGISQSAYSQMEKPDARLRQATLEKIAAAMELHPDQIRD